MGTAVATTIELRNYQQECVNRVLAQYKEYREALAGGDARTIQELREALLVLPCGAGKTIIFSHIIEALAREYRINALVLAHRDELLSQAADKYRMVKPNAIIGKIGGGIHEYGGEVTVASVQTVSRPEHIKHLKAIGYGIIICDECHHSQSDSYQRILHALSDAFVLGVTATPDRLDKKQLFGGKAPLYNRSIIDMITEGYLCDVRAIAIRTEISLDNLHTEMGDYKTDELDLAINTPSRNKRVVDAYIEHANGRRAICFGVTVAHAEALTYAFNEQGIPSATIEGNTPLDERKRLYKAFHQGDIKVLVNVQVLTEGYDEVLTSCIIMARPTQSRALYTQCLGRGLRLAPAKSDCIILDLTDNCLKHRLQPQNLRKALGKHLKDEESVLDALAREEQELLLVEKEKQVRKLPEKRHVDLHVNLLERLDWQEREKGIYVLEVGVMKHRIALIPSKEQEELYHVYARLAPTFEPQCWLRNSPLDWCQGYAEKQARTLLADINNARLVDRNASWRNKPLDPESAQVKMLNWYKIPWHAGMTKGEASDLIENHKLRIEAKKEQQAKKKAAKEEKERMSA